MEIAAEAGTDLYHRVMEFSVKEDRDGGELTRQVWSGTPWMVSVFTGGLDASDPTSRYRDIREWLYREMGDGSYPFEDAPRYGRYWVGLATVVGWTWIGFAERADMDRFVAAFPSPPQPGSSS